MVEMKPEDLEQLLRKRLVELGAISGKRIPDLDGWEAYCENCDEFRGVRRAHVQNDADRPEFFEFACVECSSVLLTFQRKRAKNSS